MLRSSLGRSGDQTQGPPVCGSPSTPIRFTCCRVLCLSTVREHDFQRLRPANQRPFDWHPKSGSERESFPATQHGLARIKDAAEIAVHARCRTNTRREIVSINTPRRRRCLAVDNNACTGITTCGHDIIPRWARGVHGTAVVYLNGGHSRSTGWTGRPRDTLQTLRPRRAGIPFLTCRSSRARRPSRPRGTRDCCTAAAPHRIRCDLSVCALHVRDLQLIPIPKRASTPVV